MYKKVEVKKSVSFNDSICIPVEGKKKKPLTWETVDDEDFWDTFSRLETKHCITNDTFIELLNNNGVEKDVIDFTIQEIKYRVDKLAYLRDRDVKPHFDHELMTNYLYCKVGKDLIKWYTGKVDINKWDDHRKFIRQSINGDIRDYWTCKLHRYTLDNRYRGIPTGGYLRF